MGAGQHELLFDKARWAGHHKAKRQKRTVLIPDVLFPKWEKDIYRFSPAYVLTVEPPRGVKLIPIGRKTLLPGRKKFMRGTKCHPPFDDLCSRFFFRWRNCAPTSNICGDVLSNAVGANRRNGPIYRDCIKADLPAEITGHAD